MQEKQNIPFLLMLKRFKNSAFVRKINSAISAIKPSKKFEGIPKRILLLRNDRIGDALVTMPVIRDIKLNYPGTSIDVLVSEKNKFIFEGFAYIDNIIDLRINGNETGIIYKLPVIGGFILSLKYIFFPLIFSGEYRKKIRTLRKQKYDYALDLVGLKRNAFLSMLIADFSAGPGRLLPFLFYDYYTQTNWVSGSDKDFMTRKIENVIAESTGIRFIKRNTGMPLTEKVNTNSAHTEKYDLVFHFGSSELRKLGFEKEKELIKGFPGKKILVTDSFATDTFTGLQKEFSGSANVTFKLFPRLEELAIDSAGASMFFCYDGGQAHYLSQYVRTLTIFGPGSPHLWKPYEFCDYEVLYDLPNDIKVMRSKGELRHLIIFKPMWCNPCFDTGCSTRPCLNFITTDIIIKVIQESIKENVKENEA